MDWLSLSLSRRAALSWTGPSPNGFTVSVSLIVSFFWSLCLASSGPPFLDVSPLSSCHLLSPLTDPTWEDVSLAAFHSFSPWNVMCASEWHTLVLSLLCGHFEIVVIIRLQWGLLSPAGKNENGWRKKKNLCSIFFRKESHRWACLNTTSILSPRGFEENTPLGVNIPSKRCNMSAPHPRYQEHHEIEFVLKQNKISPSSSYSCVIDGQIQFLLFCIKTWSCVQCSLWNREIRIPLTNPQSSEPPWGPG